MSPVLQYCMNDDCTTGGYNHSDAQYSNTTYPLNPQQYIVPPPVDTSAHDEKEPVHIAVTDVSPVMSLEG